MSQELTLIREDSNGIDVFKGLSDYDKVDNIAKTIRCLDVSNAGLLAFSDQAGLKVFSLDSKQILFEQNYPGVQFLKLSPKSSILLAWSSHKAAEDTNNLFIYDLNAKSCIQVCSHL